jgi:hypothetical protein
MSKPGVQRVTPDSKRGRQLNSRNYDRGFAPVDPEIQEWNRQVEERKLAKLQAKKARSLK